MTNESPRPGYFGFFSGLAIVLGILGIIGNAVFLGLSISHGLPPHMKAVAPAVWLSVLHLIPDAGYVVGGIKVKRRREWARKLLILCAAAALIELFYNTANSLSKGLLSPSPSTILYFVLPLLIEGSVLVYFSRRTVREFVKQ